MSWFLKTISAVANTIKELHIHKDMHIIYKQYFYKNRKKETHDLFLEYIVTVMDDLDHLYFIEESKKILMMLSMKNQYKDVSLSSLKKN